MSKSIARTYLSTRTLLPLGPLPASAHDVRPIGTGKVIAAGLGDSFLHSASDVADTPGSAVLIMCVGACDELQRTGAT